MRNTEKKFYEEGVRIIETLKNAYILYKQQSPIEQRKLLNYLLSNCKLEGRKVSYDYSLPFLYFINFDSCRKKIPQNLRVELGYWKMRHKFYGNIRIRNFRVLLMQIIKSKG